MTIKYEDILKQAAQTIDEIESLRKSYEEKMKKDQNEPSDEEKQEAEAEMADPKSESSDAQSDLVHQADEHSGEDVEDLAGYAKKLSDDELLELMEALSEEAESRGEEPSEEAQTQEEAPEAEKSEEEPPMAEEAAPESEEEAPAAEDGMGEGDELSAKVAGLSDEELEMLMAACAKEKEGRGAAGQEVEKMMPPAAPMAAPDMNAPMMMKSYMKKNDTKIDSLAKSVEAIASSINELSKRIDTIGQKKSESKVVEVVQSYADPKVKVLEKSVKESNEEFLMGTEIQNWLLDQQKKGARGVNSNLVSKAGLAKSEEAAYGLYEELKALGLNPPKKKAQ